jgi:hypothetical protein
MDKLDRIHAHTVATKEVGRNDNRFRAIIRKEEGPEELELQVSPGLLVDVHHRAAAIVIDRVWHPA